MSATHLPDMDVPDALIDAFKIGKVILFAGSGLSSFAGGYPSSSALSSQLRHEVVANTEGQPQPLQSLMGSQTVPLGLAEVAEYFELFAGADRLFSVIKQRFNNTTISPAAIHRDIWELPNTRHIYTTNFDPLIENGLSLSRTRAAPRVITDPQEFRDISLDDYLVFKLHGCAVRSHNRHDLVITRNDYLRFERQHPHRKLKAQSELMQNVFLFLGYSLDDSDFQSLYTEVRLFAEPTAQSCFAVMQDVSPAKVAFWKRLGLHILSGTAQSMVASIRSSKKLRLYNSWYEWRKKEGAREDTKQAIAQRALGDVLMGHATGGADSETALTLVVDSGTTTLAVSRRLKALLDQTASSTHEDATSGIFGSIGKLNVLTNCAAVLDNLRWLHLPSSDTSNPAQPNSDVLPALELWVLGGKLRTETQALVPPVSGTEMKVTDLPRPGFVASVMNAIDKPGRIVAFMGATAVASEGFKTNTAQEKAIKEEMIDCATEVMFLVDHSKFIEDGKCTFMTFESAQTKYPSKHISIVTDREPPPQLTSKLDAAHIIVKLVSDPSPADGDSGESER